MSLVNYLKLARLHQPTGILLLFLPCLFGIFLAAKKVALLDWLGIVGFAMLFFIGAILMRSAGCVLNDLCDHKFDAKVSRTKNRPLAAKKISRLQAGIFLAILLSLGFFTLLQLNHAAIVSGFVALGLIALYPLMKRITYYPQVFLGLTFNFGIFMSCLALLPEISLDTILLYLACVIWTVIYDTIYAYQDIEDDMKIGVKSTAIKFRHNPKKILSALNFTMFLLLVALGWHENFTVNFFLAVLVADLFLNQKIKNCDFKNAQKCLKVFKANIWVGLLILTAIILG